MQNKPNFQKAKMNVINIITRNYKNFIPLAGHKNKPNQTQFQNPTKPSKEREKRASGTFSGSQLPERI